MCYGIIASVVLLVFKSHCHCVCEFDDWAVVRYDPVLFPEDDVPEVDGVSLALSLDHQIFVAPHCEEKGEDGELVVGNQPGVGALARDHFTEEVERDRLLGLGCWVVVGVSSDLVVKKECSFFVCIERWIGSALCEEGRAYTRVGSIACSRNQLIIAF